MDSGISSVNILSVPRGFPLGRSSQNPSTQDFFTSRRYLAGTDVDPEQVKAQIAAALVPLNGEDSMFVYKQGIRNDAPSGFVAASWRVTFQGAWKKIDTNSVTTKKSTDVIEAFQSLYSAQLGQSAAGGANLL